MSSETILSFNAGYALYDPDSQIVTCKPGPGKITVTREPGESFLYFTWEPREGFKPPADFVPFDTYVLFPGDALWVHVIQCTTGRVFALKFLSSDRREFFWMQSRTDAEDRLPGSLSTQDENIYDMLEKLLQTDEEPEEEEN
ncbi:hypothetical protein D0Z00_001865 [Geotrichum galactomycetum]|uniref:Uncharacterized protein n=1 Tax=Geotrichum galactomycetum TaxID=27317 RepID=A0ACB6V5Y2_9ASCO|nr:hypothetical protein D0Z00_001865 [Geotrichum candidum]